MKQATRWAVPALVALFAVSALVGAPPVDKPGKVLGEVVAVRETTQLQNQGAWTEIQVRTRDQERLWLRLGPPDEYAGQVEVGDRIRARVRLGADGEPGEVQHMYNYRTRARIQVRDDEGELIPLQQRTRARARYGDGTGDGTAVRTRTRTREGSGGGNGGGGGGNGGGGGGR